MQAAAAAPAGRLSGQGASQRRSGPVVPVVRRTYSSRNSTNRLSTVCQLQLTRSSPAPAEPRREPEQQQGPQPAAPAPSDHSTLPQLWDRLAAQHGGALAILDPHHQPAEEYSFEQLAAAISQFAAGLQSLGLRAGDKVSLFSENGGRWLVADQAVMKCGAADAVRGTTSSFEELQYILQHSQSSALVVQDAATLDKMLPALGADDSQGTAVRFVVLLWGEPSAEAAAALGSRLHTYEAVLALGASQEFQAPEQRSTDLATLVYTSGTTGQPKGVMLTHANLLYQVSNLHFFLRPQAGQRALSLLPPWHIYERSCGYYILSCGATQVYSNIRSFRTDLTAYPPDFFVCVPLVLDTLHSKVLNTLKKASAVRRGLALGLLAVAGAHVRAQRVVDGVALQHAIQPRPLAVLVRAWLVARLLAPVYWLFRRLVAAKVRAALGIRGCVVSGGGSLSPHLDDFFEAIGLPVLNGWGLTETSPVLSCRRNQPGQNVRGSVGQPTPGTQLRLVDPETMQDVPDGERGLLLAKGPGVMAGYYNDPGATAKAFQAGDGWFDTGDLGWRAPEGVAGSAMAGTIVLTGRAKDTIVLLNGENVEPQPIEDMLCCSPYIKFAVLIGQDHRSVGALVVPDSEALEALAQERGQEALSAGEVRQLVQQHIATLPLKRWDHIAAFEVLAEPFSVDDGTLTRTMKPRRAAIMQKYAVEVKALEAHLR